MNIGIIGRARVGKDTAGKWLVDNRGFRRVAFADALKDAALKVDPILQAEESRGDWGDGDLRVSEAVKLFGWEDAKDQFPEVRRFLQEFGAAIRTLDPDFWIRIALKKVMEANDAGVPCVVTDVRYPNEAESLKRAGFYLIHIDRPGVPQLDHESEGALTADDATHRIWNDGDLDDLHLAVQDLWEVIYATESARSIHVH